MVRYLVISLLFISCVSASVSCHYLDAGDAHRALDAMGEYDQPVVGMKSCLDHFESKTDCWREAIGCK